MAACPFSHVNTRHASEIVQVCSQPIKQKLRVHALACIMDALQIVRDVLDFKVQAD